MSLSLEQICKYNTLNKKYRVKDKVKILVFFFASYS